MPSIVRFTAILLLGLASAALVACGEDGGGDEDDTIVIAVQPTSTAAELTADAEELQAFLEEETGFEIELQFPTSYAGVVEALRFGHADAAFMGAWPAALAVEEANAEIELAEVRDVIIEDEHAEEPFYYSYWVVPTESEYRSLEDLRDKKVAFASQLSTSGYVAPLGRLVELGLVERPDEGEQADAGSFFSEVVFAGGYAQAWQALQDGQVDVSIIAGDVPEELYNEVLAGTRVIEEQGPVPSHAVVYAEDFGGEARDKLTDALLKLGDDEHRELMRKFISGIFVRFRETTAAEHLAGLNKYLEATGLSFTENPPTTPATRNPGDTSPEPDPDPEAEDPTPEPDPDPEAP